MCCVGTKIILHVSKYISRVFSLGGTIASSVNFQELVPTDIMVTWQCCEINGKGTLTQSCELLPLHTVFLMSQVLRTRLV